MNSLKQYTTRHLKPWQYAIIMVVALCLLGALLGYAGKAVGEPASQDKRCTHTNIDGECWFGAKGSAKHFRDGYFAKSQGVPVKRIFKHPREARVVFSHKIARRVGHLSAAHRTRIAWHFFGHSRTPSRDGCTPTLCYGCSDYCLAWKMYGELMNKAGCVGSGRPTTSTSVCQYGGNASVTKRGIQRGGALIICGSAVAIGVLGAPESAGGSTVAAAAMTGGIGCGWSFWSSFG